MYFVDSGEEIVVETVDNADYMSVRIGGMALLDPQSERDNSSAYNRYCDLLLNAAAERGRESEIMQALLEMIRNEVMKQ